MIDIKVVKRNGDIVDFDLDKIRNAVTKAMTRTDDEDEKLPDKVARYVKKELPEQKTIKVDEIHKLVENGIMNAKAFDTAREYVTYRKEHEPDIFRERKNYKPFEYTQFKQYMDAIHQSFWVVDEFSLTSDIQEYHVDLTEHEKQVIQRTMLAISQIEARFVKTFWGNVYNRLPKPEIADVGACFSDSEARHATSYSQLLEYLGMNEIFERLDDFECLRKRQEYLKAFVSPKDSSNKEYTKSILMFSMFVENVSLFGQFLIMSSFDNYRNQLTGISNIVQSTSADESVHALFGAELLNAIRNENPDWFDQDMVEDTHEACRISMQAESEIIDWIFESGDLEFITADEIKDYLRLRFNQSMEMIDFPHVFDVKESTKEKFQWFEMQINSTTNPDFFARRNVNYTKVNKSFSEDELFDDFD